MTCIKSDCAFRAVPSPLARALGENMKDKSTADSGLPGLLGTEHIGFTVPDLDEATRFCVDIIGCEVI
jgi:hypothetical protein